MAHHAVCGLLWCKKLFETQSLLNELFSVAGNWSGFSGGGRGGEGKKKQAISLPLVPAWVSNQNIRILFLLPACKTTHTKFHLLRRMSTTLGLFYCSSSQTSMNYEVALHIHPPGFWSPNFLSFSFGLLFIQFPTPFISLIIIWLVVIIITVPGWKEPFLVLTLHFLNDKHVNLIRKF